MARAENQELVDRFEQFFRSYYREEIGELAQKYPGEQRSLHVDWGALYRFDRDLAEDFLSQPEQLREYAEEALRLYDLPVDVSLGGAHVRVHDLPDVTEIREIRERHINTLVAVRGIVRKATSVRPKVREAAFECQRCGTLTRVPQTGGTFQEPHECGGCERQGPFRVNFDQSEFVDAQTLRVQESPEGLRGGQTPESIDVAIEDDLTGTVTPGDRVTVTGVLKVEGGGTTDSPVFDVYMDGVAVEPEDEEFEEMDIGDEDRRRIVELSEADDVYERMVDSIAPTIYGYREEKLAILLQLFAGVTKHLPDGSRTRGDLHVLLIGDPGTGKCLRGDTSVTLSGGAERPIRDLVEANLDDPTPVDDGVYDEVDFEVPSLGEDGRMVRKRATRVWKREAPERMYRVETASGYEVTVTPSHPLFVQRRGRIEAAEAERLDQGEFIATPREVPTDGSDELDVDARRSQANDAVRLDLPDEWTPWLARLVGYVVAEGSVRKREDDTGFVSVTDDDRDVLDDVSDALDRLGLDSFEREPREGTSAREVVCPSSELVSFFETLEPALLGTSADQRVPSGVLSASTETKAAFLRAYVEGEGHVSATERELAVASTSEELLRKVRSLLLSLGITSQLSERRNGSYRLRVTGADFERYVERVGFVTDRKSAAARAVLDVDGNTNRDVVPDVGQVLERIRTALGLAQSECGLARSTYQHYERGDRNPSRESLRKVVEAFEAELTAEDGGRAVADGGSASLEADVAALRSLADSSILWDRIERIEPVDPDDDWVYDLEVEGTHSYLANNVVSHNSQLLQYVQNIAPRSVYTSGKGSSAAGICVTGDTMIHTADGFVPIRELAEKHHPNPVVEETAAEATYDLYTFDRKTGGIDRSASSHVWRMPEKPCRYIETTHGKELEASVDTPVLVCGDDGMEWRAVSDVEPGDYVAVPKYDDLARSSPPIDEFVEYTNEKVKPTDDSVAFLRRRLRDEFGTLRDAAAALGLSEDFIYDSLSNRHLPLDKLDRILDAIGAGREDVDVERAMLRHGDSVRIPDEFTGDLMYLVGLVFGDGDMAIARRGGNRGYVRISNSDEQLLAEAADIIESTFDKSVDIEYQEDRVPCVRLHSATVARFFSNLGMESPKDDLTLDPRLTTAAHADAFLRGLFDADGSVSVRDDGGSSIQFSTISEELARQVQLMLESYGIRARLRERDKRGTYELEDGYEIESSSITTHLTIYGKDIDAYAERIGFRSEPKSDALASITEAVPRRGERLPLGGTLARTDGAGGPFYQTFNRADDPSRERARAILADRDLGDLAPAIEEVVEADLVWDEVVAAGDAGRKEVFDITVPETHNFVGNGIVTHNTAAAVRDDFGEGQQWTLEAGALVLADKGVAAVDELDKMRCVTGDTLVYRGDGGVSPIRDLAVEAADGGSVEPLPNGRTIRGVEVTAWTMTDDGRVVRRPVTAIHEYEAPATLTEVTLASGERLAATDDHPFFVLDDGEWTTRAAADLDPGDRACVPKWPPEAAADGGWFPDAAADGGSGVADGPSGDPSGGPLGPDVTYRRVAAVESVDVPDGRKVYDLTVEGTHNFVANGMVVHNSEDRSALHEALSQQQISVSKAGINATLKSRCALLGAANPKYGRFDQYEPIAEQIDLEPALISRFDLIFTVTDQPDAEADAELAEHILQKNYAGELSTQRSELASPAVTDEQVAAASEEVAPAIDPELLRKYVAHARATVYPTMTEPAKEAIRDFYVDLRAKGQDEDAPVPVTARKLEALIRLAEASARVRLSDRVAEADAERVIELVRSCLQDIGVDPETGQFDADVVETGTSKSQRDRIRTLKQLIADIQDDYEEGAPVEEVLERADEVGMEPSKAEHEIEKLKQKGEVYEPATDHLRTT